MQNIKSIHSEHISFIYYLSEWKWDSSENASIRYYNNIFRVSQYSIQFKYYGYVLICVILDAG